MHTIARHMPASKTAPCPSCRTAMARSAFGSVDGGTVELDMCFACQGIWFDPQENLKLTPAALVELFRLLHAQRDAPRQPLSAKLSCPHCTRTLAQGFDVVRSGRYITFRCPNRDGRFSTFSAFMQAGFWLCPPTTRSMPLTARAISTSPVAWVPWLPFSK